MKRIESHNRVLMTRGHPALLNSITLGLFCSVKCPGSIILKMYDMAQDLKVHQVSVASGFHSPIEKDMLVTLLRGEQPIIVCPARTIDTMRIPKDWQPHIDNERLAVVSPFIDSPKRASAHSAGIRNQFVASLSKTVFIAYASEGGKTEQFAKDLCEAGKIVYTFDDDYTHNLREMGAKIFSIETLLKHN